MLLSLEVVQYFCPFTVVPTLNLFLHNASCALLFRLCSICVRFSPLAILLLQLSFPFVSLAYPYFRKLCFAFGNFSASAGLRVAGLRVAGLRVAGLRVAGLQVAGQSCKFFCKSKLAHLCFRKLSFAFGSFRKRVLIGRFVRRPRTYASITNFGEALNKEQHTKTPST